ncbi:DUF475 domain-containing protein [Sulfitobacter mediterraneus]|uniref:DUF475 domain-containing protein n=1 Tax=Sulfitobacter mediterraneus TaxID=83219 RepID=UPI0019345ECD|nr:DUF475 domain-containing protein [Sulfitobacter mediterraneus]MBM1310959.1 DUF475 domain-containing protein [Sulfitobacter mediterraneus]MBM1314842.1 DUF475 domain-containing protein [Sulfitobacter mediterraneus]MBM1323202.1 DUF475 domain-containing protein [Sulfitobacter mediterraneus]MBM1327114.1 DUF475 domain-containing protein [Sulfitobacter mediterraneus]MBM1398461.1 DUF475 domain-containing protein [Sulfitobacter mediterraneus]
MSTQRSSLSYLKWPLITTVLGLGLTGWLGWATKGDLGGIMSFLMVGAVLAALEIALSFDNAIVNANKLDEMTPVWQQRFLTWGILIAVFGMRIVFPLAIVAIFAWINPFAAMHLALADPDEYSRIIGQAHGPISAFGGTFLMMVALKFFIDEDKSIDWIEILEKRLRVWGSIRGFEIAFVLVIVLLISRSLPIQDVAPFLTSAVMGLLVFTMVEGLGTYLDNMAGSAAEIGAKGGLGAFLYLEVLDASFSFDGVIGAFALTTNILLIAIGLGIGAMYVRSMTIMLVERGSLAEFRYLEHGAFYSIFALSIVMFLQSIVHVHELITGGIGMVLIALAFYASINHNKRET